jgi:glucose-1-phosphate cytidylyltransferase
MTKVVIFCGGYGTRIRDVADDLPKPLIRVGERPIVWHIMSIYARYGVTEFILTLGYKGWLIKEYFLNYRRFVSDITLRLSDESHVQIHRLQPVEDWTITLAETGLDTQTGGRLAQARRYLRDDELFCVTYGDGVADIDIAKLIAFHQSHGKIATVTGVHPPARFGVLDVAHEDGLQIVRQFSEKPQSLEGMINGGFFVFDSRIWNYVHDDPDMPLEREPLMRLAEDRQLAVYEHDGFWQPMDTYRDWKLLNTLWANGSAPWSRS